MLNRTLSDTQGRTHVALLLGLVSVAVWTVGTLGAGSAQVAPTEITMKTGLLTTNRHSLKLCVNSTVAGMSDAALQATITAALQKASAHPRFARAGFAVSPPQVEIGCPGVARIAEPGFDPRAGYSNVGGVLVDQPTQYRTYVYLVPQEQLAALGGLGHQRVPQEVYCPPLSDNCAAVSTAVYLSPGDIPNLVKVARELAGGLGLDARGIPAGP